MGIVWVFNIIALIRGGDAWLGLAYLLILLIPVSSLAILKLTGSRHVTIDSTLNLAIPLTLKHMITHPKPQLSLKTA